MLATSGSRKLRAGSTMSQAKSGDESHAINLMDTDADSSSNDSSTTRGFLW
jgi:hypothetical protein